MANTARQNKRKRFAEEYTTSVGPNHPLGYWAYNTNRRVDARKRKQFRRAKEKGNG